MQVEVFINEDRLDTNSATRISETKQVNDFFSIDDRQTSYTPSFKLPFTDRNRRILGMMGVVGNTSLVPYRVHNVSIYRNGIQTVSQGIGFFKPTTDHYNLYVYSENIDLFDKLGNATISDLDLSALSHTLNINNWLASFSRSDYIYALSDYGKLEDEIELNYQVPSLFTDFLWRRIFNKAGFKWKYVGRGGRDDFNPFITEEWKSTCITIDQGLPKAEGDVDPIKKLELSKIKTTKFVGNSVNFLGNEIVVQKIEGQILDYIQFKSDFDEDGIHAITNSSQYNRSRIRVIEDGFYRIEIVVEFYNLDTESVSMFIEKDGFNLMTIKEDFPSNQSTATLNQKVYLQKGDELFVKIVSTANIITHYSYDIVLRMALDNSVTHVNLQSYFSKIKQRDFIKDMIAHYGLIHRRRNDTYEFMSIDELLDPTARYVNYDALANGDVYEDWSDKFDSIIEDSSKVGSYAQRNNFGYKYDNPEDTFADASLDIDDQTLDLEKTVVQRLYKAPSRRGEVISNIQVPSCSMFEKQFNDDGSLKNVKEKKSGHYFFRSIRTNATIDYKLAGATNFSTFKGEVPFMSFDGLDFNNILPNRYSAFANTINYSKKYTVELFVSILDIHNLDFFKLKYIKQLGGLFYLNKVSNFTGTGKTKIELIRVRSIEKLGQFSDDYSDDYNT